MHQILLCKKIRKKKQHTIKLSSVELAESYQRFILQRGTRKKGNSKGSSKKYHNQRTYPAGTWRLCNVGSTSMQRHDVASTLRRRCIHVMCLLGSLRMRPRIITGNINARLAPVSSDWMFVLITLFDNTLKLSQTNIITIKAGHIKRVPSSIAKVVLYGDIT